MATGFGDSNLIEPVDSAQPAVSEDDKAKVAEAEAAADVEAANNAPTQRFVEFVLPRAATASYVDENGKRRRIETRPSGEVDDGSYASRVGVASAEAVIRPQDWPAPIVADQTLRWDFANNWRVPAASLSVEQLDCLLIEDRRHNGVRFELVDGTGRKVDR